MGSAIEVINLTRQYTNVLAVDRINFEPVEGSWPENLKHGRHQRYRAHRGNARG